MKNPVLKTYCGVATLLFTSGCMTGLDGTYVSGCAKEGSYRVHLNFDGDRFSGRREHFSSPNCQGKGTLDEQPYAQGTFEEGGKAELVADAVELDLHFEKPHPQTNYTIFLLQDQNLFLGRNTPGRNGGTDYTRHLEVETQKVEQIYTEVFPVPAASGQPSVQASPRPL